MEGSVRFFLPFSFRISGKKKKKRLCAASCERSHAALLWGEGGGGRSHLERALRRRERRWTWQTWAVVCVVCCSVRVRGGVLRCTLPFPAL